jgi:hypothetical protein
LARLTAVVGSLSILGLKNVLSKRKAFEQLEDFNAPKKAKKTKSSVAA